MIYFGKFWVIISNIYILCYNMFVEINTKCNIEKCYKYVLGVYFFSWRLKHVHVHMKLLDLFRIRFILCLLVIVDVLKLNSTLKIRHDDKMSPCYPSNWIITLMSDYVRKKWIAQLRLFVYTNCLYTPMWHFNLKIHQSVKKIIIINNNRWKIIISTMVFKVVWNIHYIMYCSFFSPCFTIKTKRVCI